MRNLTVADVMTPNVIKAREQMPLKELARLLAEHHISAMPVLDPDDHVVGVVSEHDILRKLGREGPRREHWWQSPEAREEIRRAEGDTVGRVMTPDPVTISPEKTLAQAARRMTEHNVKRLPVVGADGELVGIVSRADLLRSFLRTDDEIRKEILDEVFVHLLWSDPTGVEVSVVDGIVTLEGSVEQRSTAELAERLVRRVDGVVDIVSTLTYRIDDGGTARR